MGGALQYRCSHLQKRLGGRREGERVTSLHLHTLRGKYRCDGGLWCSLQESEGGGSERVESEGVE